MSSTRHRVTQEFVGAHVGEGHVDEARVEGSAGPPVQKARVTPQFTGKVETRLLGRQSCNTKYKSQCCQVAPSAIICPATDTTWILS